MRISAALSSFGSLQTHDAWHHNVQPGLPWVERTRYTPTFGLHTTTIGDLLTDEHYDVFVRAGYVQTLVNGTCGEERRTWSQFYERMQRARVGVSRRAAFDRLIHTMERDGFLSSAPLPLTVRYQLLDGAHRLACAAALNYRPFVELFGTVKAHRYTRTWLTRHGWDTAEMQLIDEVRKAYLMRYCMFPRQCGLLIVWPPALEFWEAIVHLLCSSGTPPRRARIVHLDEYFPNFVLACYEEDGMSRRRAEEKAQRLRAYGSHVGLLMVEGSCADLDAYKHALRETFARKVQGYFFDCVVHCVDGERRSKMLFRALTSHR